MQKLKYSGATGVALGLFLATAAPALAAHHHHHRSYYRHYDRAYVDTDRGEGAYAWAPRGYGVRGWYNSSDVNERLCMLSPSSIDYRPCMNWW